ncbi:MAG: exodeoxyribonuclease VII small subunit [Dehalococcoidia bacterium]|nr:exodeoxyribonuclease VII small subunit [Dehalococcoidia bacterium]
MTDPAASLPPDAPFEAVFAELESVVARLETGGLGLDEAMALYARGMALARRCAEQLDAAQLRLVQLSDDSLTPPGAAAAIDDDAISPLRDADNDR